MTKDECMKIHPDHFPMHIKSQREWGLIAAAVNVGIDSYLEAFTRSTFDSNTGKVDIHPEEMHILLRRLNNIWEETCDEEAYTLRDNIISVMNEDDAL